MDIYTMVRRPFLTFCAAFIFAVAAGASVQAADVPDKSLGKVTEKCGGPAGVVLEMPDQPGTVIAVFCDDELRAFGCRPLSLIRNYLLYSSGLCLNNSEMFRYAFSRKGCEAQSAQNSNNDRVFSQTLQAGVTAMVKRVRAVEVQKNCIVANEGQQ